MVLRAGSGFRPLLAWDMAAAAANVDLGFTRGFALATRIDGNDNGLGAEAASDTRDQIGIGNGGGVNGDLVSARGKDLGRIFQSANAAAYGERNKYLAGSAADRFDEGLAFFMGGGDVEQHNLIGAGFGVSSRQLRRIACIAQVQELVGTLQL